MSFKPAFIMLGINLMLFVGGATNYLGAIDDFGQFNSTMTNSTLNDDVDNFDNVTFSPDEDNAPTLGEGSARFFATIFLAKDVVTATVINQVFNPIQLFVDLGFPGAISIVMGIMLIVLNVYAVLAIIIGR